MRPHVLMLLLALVSAGCAGTADEPMDAAATPAAPRMEAAAELREDPATEPPDPVIRLDEQGRLAPSAVLCPPLALRTHCVEPLGPGAFGVEDWLEGRLVSLDVTLTWTPSSRLSESLVLALGGCAGTPEEYVCETLATVEGTGPLALRSDAPEGMSYFFVGVTANSLGAGPAAAHLTLEQPVHLEGEVRWRPAPP